MTIESVEVARPQYVGSRVLRVEDPRFLRGRARYIDDIVLPRVAHAAFLRSPLAHARIKRIDTGRAKALDGVVAVYTGDDLAAHAQPIVSLIPGQPDVRAVTHPILATEKVRHVGEPIAVVVAESRYIAEDAMDLIDLEWERLPVLLHAEEALEPDAPLLHEEFDNNNIAHMASSHGDVDAAFAEADYVFSKRFHSGRYLAAPLETRGIVAEYDEATDETVMWSSTQVPHFTRTLIAPLIGVSEAKLRIVAPAVGGGFGLKCIIFPEDVVVPVVARLVRRPVKWIEDRYENLAASSHAKEIICYVDIAVKADGTFLAFRGRYVTDSGAYSAMPWTALIDALPSGPLLPSIYDVKHVQWEIDAPMTNKCATGPYRAVGITPGHNAREVLIDDIARALDIDPVELRLKNCIPSEPYTTATGQHYDGGSYAECIRETLEILDYPTLRERQQRVRQDGRYLGIGISPFVEPTAYGSQIAQATGMTWQEALLDVARVTVEPDGSVTVTTGQCSHGQSHETTFAQLAADTLGVRLEDVVIKEGDSSATPYGMGTWASRSAVIGGGGIIRAGREVREKLVRMAAQAMEVSPDDVELTNSVASVKGVPGKSMTVGELAMFAYFGGAQRPADIDEPFLTSARSYDPPETYTNGCIGALVEVDVQTGRVDVQRLVAVEDCGVMLNPMVVEGQVAGALAQGIGGALFEELPYDENGQFLAGTLMDYLLPSTTEVPPIEIGHIETPALNTEGGIKGVGEGGMIAAPAAVLNAVADALSPFGITLTKSPLAPNDILALIRDAKESGVATPREKV